MSASPVEVQVTPGPGTPRAAARPAADAVTALTGRRRTLARALWLAGVLVYTGLFLVGMPAAYERALVLAPDTLSALAGLGLAANAPAVYWLTLDALTMLGFAFIALLIVARRPDDWLVMLTSLTLLGTAALYTGPPAEARVPLALTAVAFALAEIWQVAFVYLFPNGRIRPRWVGLLIVPLFLWRPAVWGMVYLPNFYASVRSGENYGTLRQDPLDTAVMIVLFLIGIGSQVYRYRRAESQVQRQQTKWLVLGIIGAIAVAASYVIIVNALGLSGGSGPEALAIRVVGRTARQIALLLLPVTLAFSILRYRLWDIDILLRRTLVYVPLTAILAGLFAAVVTILQKVFVAFTGQGSLVATLLTTIVVVAAVEPVKDALERVVAQRFKMVDPDEKLKQFGMRVQTRLSTVEPAQILRLLLNEAMTALAATGGAMLLEQAGQLRPAAIVGAWAGNSELVVPVEANGKRYGAIALGARSHDQPYGKRERAALERAARIVASAIQEDAPL